MSVSIQTVEFERREAHLSELEDGAPWTVHGVALGSGDVTVGQSGIKKLWPADELEKGADTLEGRSLVVDHNNQSDGVVGTVTKAGYKDDVGVIYEAELFDEELAEKINNGLLEVSIRGKHIDVDSMEENEDGAKVVEGIKFDNLSIVPTGAAPSNTIEMGETEELSVAELAEFADSLESAELAEIEPGMWVTDGDMHGITISAVNDGEVEVDVYEESDGSWSSTAETTMVSTDDLSEWDVDEDDIEARESDEEDDEEEEASEHGDIPDKFFYESEDEAMSFIEGKDGLTGIHEMDDMYVPGDTHSEFMDWWEDQSEEMAPSWNEGDLVQWQVEPQLFGKIVHVDEKRGIVMVEIHERMDGELETTNFTVSAGFSDLQALDHGEEEMEEELEGSTHKPSYSGTDDNEWNKPSLNDFTEESWEDLPSEEKSDIGDHFIFSMTGFPADNYSDMKLPVVRPSGTLSMNAVRNAKSRLSQTDGLSGDQRDSVESMLNNMLGEDKEEAAYRGNKRSRTIDDTGRENTVEDTGPVDVTLRLIDAYLSTDGKRQRDSVDRMLSWLMGATDIPMETVGDVRKTAGMFLDQTPGTDSFGAMTIEQFRDWLLMQGQQSRRNEPQRDVAPADVLTGDDFWQRSKSKTSELDETTNSINTMTEEDIEQKLAELNEPVAVEQGDLEELQQKADRFDEMSESLESLKERTDILDEVDQEKIEELRGSEEPVVVESARFESLEAEAEQVKEVYAAALSDEMPAFSGEELADRFSIEELREKYEEQIGDPAEELASSETAEPRSGDVEEEELAERAEEEEVEETEELESDEAAEMRANLKDKILQ